MTIHEQIEHDYLVAFKGHEQAKVDVLRLMKAAMKNAEIELRVQVLDDAQAMVVLKREAKRRKESIAMFQQGGRMEMAELEVAELSMISHYLPAELGDEQLHQVVQAVIAEMKPTPKDFGKVMAAVMAKVKGQADGNRVSAAVKQFLK